MSDLEISEVGALEHAALALGLRELRPAGSKQLLTNMGLFDPFYSSEDSMLLICRLGLRVHVDLVNGWTIVETMNPWKPGGSFKVCRAHRGDVDGSTRHAIVVAAAAIGRHM